jgi:uncharacterized protein (DUF697 family)
LLPLAKNVVSVRAIREQLDDGHCLEPKGLNDLVTLTLELVPEGSRRAFTAAQKVDLALKRQRSQMIVATACATAVGLGATPIPFADAALLVPVQVGMIAGITATYGLSFSDGFLSALVASTVTGTGATLTGRSIVSGLFKLFPGAGTVIGGAIAATTAGALTGAFGAAYIAALDALFTRNQGEPPTANEVLAEVKRRFSGTPEGGPVAKPEAKPAERKWYQLW